VELARGVSAFPGQVITFVERNRLQEILSEQDLLQGSLDDRTRAKIKQTLGIEALIMWSDPFSLAVVALIRENQPVEPVT